MATTVGSVIERVVSRLSVNSRDTITLLTSAVNDTTVTFPVAEAVPSIRAGETMAVDYEVVLVTAIASLNVTVIRGWGETVAAAHADDSVVFIQPRFPRGELFENFKEEIKSWGSQLYRIVSTDVPFNPTGNSAQVFVPIDGSFVTALRVEKNDPYLGWVKAQAQISNSLTTVAEGSDTIRLSIWDVHPRVTQYRVKYGVRFDIYDIDGNEPTADTTFDEMGIPEEYADIAIFGTMWRTLMGRESTRIDMQSAKRGRSASDVREQASSQTSAYWKSLRDQRLREESANLNSRNA